MAHLLGGWEPSCGPSPGWTAPTRLPAAHKAEGESGRQSWSHLRSVLTFWSTWAVVTFSRAFCTCDVDGWVKGGSSSSCEVKPSDGLCPQKQTVVRLFPSHTFFRSVCWSQWSLYTMNMQCEVAAVPRAESCVAASSASWRPERAHTRSKWTCWLVESLARARTLLVTRKWSKLTYSV